MDLQAKLSNFYKMVMSEAESKNLNEFTCDLNKIKNEIKNYFDAAYSYMTDQVNIKKLKLNDQTDKCLALKLLETKKKLLLKRLDLKRMFFIELEKKVTDFVESDDYKKQILKELNEFDPKKYKFKNFVFEFSDKDQDLISVIANNFAFEIMISKDNFIGGYKIYANNHKILIDKTFKCRLEKLKNQFNKFKLINL